MSDTRNAGIHRIAFMCRQMQVKIKAIRIPMPPPLGMGTVCELLASGLSINPRTGAYLIVKNAPALPMITDIKQIETRCQSWNSAEIFIRISMCVHG